MIITKAIKNIFYLPKFIFGFLGSVANEMKKTEFPKFSVSIKLAYIVILGTVLISTSLYLIDTLFAYLRNTYLTNQ